LYILRCFRNCIVLLATFEAGTDTKPSSHCIQGTMEPHRITEYFALNAENNVLNAFGAVRPETMKSSVHFPGKNKLLAAGWQLGNLTRAMAMAVAVAMANRQRKDASRTKRLSRRPRALDVSSKVSCPRLMHRDYISQVPPAGRVSVDVDQSQGPPQSQCPTQHRPPPISQSPS